MLWEIIRSLRESRKWTKEEFASRIGKSDTYVRQMELPPGETNLVPSAGVLKTIAQVFAKNKDERDTLEKRLLFHREMLVMPDFMRDYVSCPPEIAEGMPQAFIKKLNEDIRDYWENNNDFFNSIATIENARELIIKTLQGEFYLSRKTVIELASKLGQSVDEYLSLANYKARIKDREGQSMPKPFLARLRQDIMKGGKSKEVFTLLENSEINKATIDMVFEGKLYLPKQTVVLIANLLGQPVEEYCIFAGYFPHTLERFAQNKKSLVLLRTISKLSADDMEFVDKILSNILQYKQHPRDEKA